MNQDTWRFINSFAPWVSALGTLTAVVVSLRLARRAAAVDLRVSQAIVQTGRPGQQVAWEEMFQIRVVNHRRDAIVKGIAWKLVGSRQQWIVLPPNDAYSAKLPAKLEFGEEAMFFFPTATFNHLGKHLLDYINSSRQPGLTVRRLRVGVYTSTGQSFWTAPDARLRHFLIARSRQVAGAETQ